MGFCKTIICVYVCVVVECIYTCKTEDVGNNPLCWCLCCFRGYVLGAWLGSVVGLIIGFNEGTELVFWMTGWTCARIQLL